MAVSNKKPLGYNPGSPITKSPLSDYATHYANLGTEAIKFNSLAERDALPVEDALLFTDTSGQRQLDMTVTVHEVGDFRLRAHMPWWNDAARTDAERIAALASNLTAYDPAQPGKCWWEAQGGTPILLTGPDGTRYSVATLAEAYQIAGSGFDGKMELLSAQTAAATVTLSDIEVDGGRFELEILSGITLTIGSVTNLLTTGAGKVAIEVAAHASILHKLVVAEGIVSYCTDCGLSPFQIDGTLEVGAGSYFYFGGNAAPTGTGTVRLLPGCRVTNADILLLQNGGITVDDQRGTSSGGSSALADLTDVALSSVANQQVLRYNSTSGKWENATISTGGGQATNVQAALDNANAPSGTNYFLTVDDKPAQNFLVPSGGTAGQVLTAQGNGTRAWATPSGGAAQNSLTPASTTVAPSVDAVVAGLAGKQNTEAGKGLSANDYTTTEKSKLAGIATSATQNQTDAYLLSRANHTGEQAISTVTGLTAALAAANVRELRTKPTTAGPLVVTFEIDRASLVGSFSLFTNNNVTGLTYKKNGVTVTLPQTVALNDTIEITGTVGSGGGLLEYRVS